MHGLLTSPAKSEMLSISLFAEIIKVNRVAINISPLCGDDSAHLLQRTNRRTFEAKPVRAITLVANASSIGPTTQLLHYANSCHELRDGSLTQPQHTLQPDKKFASKSLD